MASMDPDKVTAVQAVVDRVSSYQDGATESTLESELRKALGEAGIELDDHQVGALVAAIEADSGQADAEDALS